MKLIISDVLRSTSALAPEKVPTVAALKKLSVSKLMQMQKTLVATMEKETVKATTAVANRYSPARKRISAALAAVRSGTN